MPFIYSYFYHLQFISFFFIIFQYASWSQCFSDFLIRLLFWWSWNDHRSNWRLGSWVRKTMHISLWFSLSMLINHIYNPNALLNLMPKLFLTKQPEAQIILTKYPKPKTNMPLFLDLNGSLDVKPKTNLRPFSSLLIYWLDSKSEKERVRTRMKDERSSIYINFFLSFFPLWKYDRCTPFFFSKYDCWWLVNS